MPTINLTDDQLETIDAALEFVDTQRLADRYLDMGEFEHEQVTAARIALRTSQPAMLESSLSLEEAAADALEWIDEIYPPDIFDGSSGDEGPVRIVAIRENLRTTLRRRPPAAP